ncbi:hypothetical protein NLI96_g11159 [Meripilus lineatus]|uniref:Hydrophobin n=1 Tax=Meripilus lineatus TaxID=2056292 RepID=A0AAD5UTR2_9APHY|nr:hypothetical protein NLI96_g11159 [Physisporinus lineatus]
MFTRFVTPFVALLFLIASFAAALPWAQPPASTKVVTVTHIVTASPTTPTEPADSPGGTCNAGKTAQCCDSVHQPGTPEHQSAANGLLAGVNAPNALGNIGLGCTPIANLASTCKSQAMCCNSSPGSLRVTFVREIGHST